MFRPSDHNKGQVYRNFIPVKMTNSGVQTLKNYPDSQNVAKRVIYVEHLSFLLCVFFYWTSKSFIYSIVTCHYQHFQYSFQSLNTWQCFLQLYNKRDKEIKSGKVVFTSIQLVIVFHLGDPREEKKIGTNMYYANILVFFTDFVFHNNRTEDRFQDKAHKFHDKSKLMDLLTR